jgi:hypothetical protein
MARWTDFSLFVKLTSQEFFFRVKHAYSPWPAHLVHRKREKVHVQVLNVDPLVGYGLGGVKEHPCAITMGNGDDFFGRYAVSREIGTVCHAHQSDALALELLLKGVKVEGPVSA